MLLDTSGLFALFDRGEANHSEAVRIFDSSTPRIVHNYVLTELVALCHARRRSRNLSLAFVATIQDSPLVKMIWIDESQHRAALSFLQSRADKSYSLCDAVSFLLMRDLGVAEALTTDRHFEQEGFKRLLAP